MGVSLVYLGRNDEPAGPKQELEMYQMCQAIEAKLKAKRIQVQQTNLGQKVLPSVNTVEYNEVWFCGHSRFVEKNMSIRGFEARNLGGFSMQEIADFIKSCATKGKGKSRFRLICCESAQQQPLKPSSGKPPAEFTGVLGNEYLVDVTNATLDSFKTDIHTHQSHLEGLILAMAQLWANDTSQFAFEICGLWGAGDINDKEPITSFLQHMGGLEAVEAMDNPNVAKKKQQTAAKQTAAKWFQNARCSTHGLPDFFGYRISNNLLVQWARKPPQSQPEERLKELIQKAQEKDKALITNTQMQIQTLQQIAIENQYQKFSKTDAEKFIGDCKNAMVNLSMHRLAIATQ
jgi:hypothetical protein